MMHTPQTFNATPKTLFDIKQALEEVRAIFTNRANDEQLFFAALHLLRTTLETLGNLEPNQLRNSIAQKMCREAKQLRHALIHGGPRINDPGRITEAVCQEFSAGIPGIIQALDNPNCYHTTTSNVGFFSTCRLYQSLIDYDSIPKSMQHINPEDQLNHIRHLSTVSSNFTEKNALAYCWGGILESLVRLTDFRDSPQSLQQLNYSYITNAVGSFENHFRESLRAIRRNRVHSDIESAPSPFVHDQQTRRQLLNIIHDFSRKVETNKDQSRADLRNQIARNNPRDDQFVAGHPLATPEQLTIIARRRPELHQVILQNPNVNSYVLAEIVNASSANDQSAAKHPLTTAVQLIIIAQRTPNTHAAILQHLNANEDVKKAVRNTANDAWIATHPQATPEQLASIARRATNPAILVAVAMHPATDHIALTEVVNNQYHNVHSDTAIVANKNTLPIDLTTINDRSPELNAAIARHPDIGLAPPGLFFMRQRALHPAAEAQQPQQRQTPTPIITPPSRPHR